MTGLAESIPAQSHARSLEGVRLLAGLPGIELFGNERSTIEALKSLRGAGAEVKVVVADHPENQVRVELERLGFETFSVPFGAQFSKMWMRKHPTMLYYYISRLLRSSLGFAMQARKFHATHYMLGTLTAFGYLGLALRRLKGRLIYVMHDCPPEGSAFNLWLWRSAVRRTDSLVCVSKFVAKKAKQFGAEDPIVIYNRDSEHHSAGKDATEPESKRRNSLVYLGSIAEHKGLVELVDAVALVVPSYPGLSLKIIGGSKFDNEFREHLKDRIRKNELDKNIQLAGYSSDPSGELRSALVHIAPSVWEEPLGMVVLEAKREGTPSIVFRSGGLPEMVSHQVDGYVCPEKTAESLAAAILWMLANTERLDEMGRAAVDSYERDFSPWHFDERWRELLLDRSVPPIKETAQDE